MKTQLSPNRGLYLPFCVRKMAEYCDEEAANGIVTTTPLPSSSCLLLHHRHHFGCSQMPRLVTAASPASRGIWRLFVDWRWTMLQRLIQLGWWWKRRWLLEFHWPNGIWTLFATNFGSRSLCSVTANMMRMEVQDVIYVACLLALIIHLKQDFF